ncbi:MAG: homoserine kinase [Rhodospirillaceae bacterium]|jgi:homoserine kinase type II|nr:homoserine kinase [Rhodospirillaceae bacterium]MBT4486554.1 homoserine kinase [Rhodospirillaceae bacterium]MBT5191712.1 homoserine kinase [Rhodospirillaceae bacterium]MBT5898968.1 homoserine kinase [Rhodospirillaceae bacterium]MBT6426614.1 homoserine kinase [Rhodospirillaceae bacterium]
MAVYTEIGDDELRDFVAQYDIGAVTGLKGIAEGVENTNYLLQTDRGSYILTIYEKRVDPKDLPFFLGLLDHLSTRGVPCPSTIHGRDGKALRQIAGKPAAVQTFLQGIWPKRPTAVHCGEVGAALARMHLAGRDYPNTRPNALSIDGWAVLVDATAARADHVAAGLGAEIAREFEYLSEHWPADLPVGVIHADLFPDNVFFMDDKLTGLIDFYFACTDALAYDLAICLNAWCFERSTEFNITKARRLLSAYRQVRPVGDDELAALPLLARGSALRFLLTRLYDWLNQVDGAMVKPKDPMEYLHKMRFHRRIDGPGAYGLE